MKYLKILLIVTCFMPSLSCSRLVVDVRTADRDKLLVKYQEIKKELNALHAARVAESIVESGVLDSIRNNWESLRVLSEEKFNASGVPEWSPSYFLDSPGQFVYNIEMDSIIEDYKGSSEYSSALDNYQTNVNDKVETLNSSLKAVIDLANSGNYELAMTNYNDANTQIEELSRINIEPTPVFLDGQLQGNYYAGGPPIQAFAEALKKVSDKKKKEDEEFTNHQRANLLGDEMASFVSKYKTRYDGKDTLWTGKYNKTKSWTAMGNSDIAVVLNEDPDSYNNNYTIKGVRVDADKLIQSSFDALAQGINLIATAQGVATQPSTDDNYFAPDYLPQVQELEDAQTDVEIKQKNLEKAKELLIQEILDRNLDGKSGTGLKNEVDELKQLWSILKAQLEKNLTKETQESDK